MGCHGSRWLGNLLVYVYICVLFKPFCFVTESQVLQGWLVLFLTVKGRALSTCPEVLSPL